MERRKQEATATAAQCSLRSTIERPRSPARVAFFGCLAFVFKRRDESTRISPLWKKLLNTK
jgi:hypothetical protein